MKVIDHEPKLWFFLQYGEEYLLDVYCSYSFAGFSRLIRLNELETKQYNKQGKVYLNNLAADIQYYAMSKYKERHLGDKLTELVYKAIMDFNENQKLKK